MPHAVYTTDLRTGSPRQFPRFATIAPPHLQDLSFYFALSGALDAPDVMPRGATVFRLSVRGTAFIGSGEAPR